MQAMSDDFFADLVALKPKPGSSPVDENGRAAVGGAFDQDAVLASGVDTSKGIQSPEVPDLLGRDPRELGAPLAPMGSSSSTRAQGQVKEFEASVEATMKRFASGLERVLEDVVRRLDALEGKADRLGKALQDSREVDTLREDAFKERFTTLDKGLREVNRSVQLVKDKQELLEAQAEVAKLASKTVDEAPPTPAPTPALSRQESAPPAAAAPTPTPSLTPVDLPKAPTPVAAPPPVPTVPPMPASAPAAPAAPLQPSPPLQVQQAPAPQQVAPEPQTQYSAPPPAPPQQPQQYQPPPVPHVQQEQQFQNQQYSTAPQMPPPPPALAPYNPPQQAPQFSAPPPVQQYSAPPPPKPFSAPPPQAFSSYGGASSARYGSSPSTGGGPTPFQGPSSYGGQNAGGSGYPTLVQSQPSLPNAPPQPHRYHSGGAPPPQSPGGGYRGPSYAPSPPGEPSGYGAGQSVSRPQPPPSGQTASRNVPLEQVIDDVASMGFSRHDVRAVVSDLMDKGQAVDLNVVLDRLMNGPRR